MATESLTNPLSPELNMLINNKTSGYNYRERRQEEWTENYTLYRDRVLYNRLTQRQSVNVPLMKKTIRTLLKDVDDMPNVFFESLDNDKEAEVFQNEYWKWTLAPEQNNAEVKDIVDKRQVMMYGRSFDQWQIIDGVVKFNIVDVFDMLVDRYMDPTDIDSSRFLIHTHIFVPLAKLKNNEKYDKEAIKRLETWHTTDEGLIRNAENQSSLEEKNKRLADLDLTDVDNPILGETIIELSMHFVYHQEKEDEEEQLYLYVEADDREILMKKRLEEVIGPTKDHYWRKHYPYNTWADDVDHLDFWTDGIADIVRTPNKILNTWISQLVEHRTLRSFGMNYYDGTKEGFNPQTYQAIPFGWYATPGKPDDIVKKIDIPDLSESLDEMTYVEQMAEKATGATATQQGVQTERNITLGEVQLALGEAKERVKGMSKFYTPVWMQRGIKFLKLIEAGKDQLDAVKIYKKGRNTDDLYMREIGPNDWMTKSGYVTRVWSQDERNQENTAKLEKLNAAKMNMPDNPKLTEIFQRKLLEFADLNPDQINEVMEYEQQKMRMQMMMNQMMMNQMMMNPMAAGGGPMGAMNMNQPAFTPPPAPTPSLPSATEQPKSKNTVNKLKSVKNKLTQA